MPARMLLIKNEAVYEIKKPRQFDFEMQVISFKIDASNKVFVWVGLSHANNLL